MSDTFKLQNGAKVFPAMEQGSENWLEVRRGIATASKLSDVMAKGRAKGSVGKVMLTYAAEVASEILNADPPPNFSSIHMERGKLLEPEVRAIYQLIHEEEVQMVGFVRLDDIRFGASPDGLVGTDGGLEIKTHLPTKIVQFIADGKVPDEHLPQLDGFLFATNRQWIDLAAYWPGLDPFIVRHYRDDERMEEIASALQVFNETVDDFVAKYHRFAEAPRLLGNAA